MRIEKDQIIFVAVLAVIFGVCYAGLILPIRGEQAKVRTQIDAFKSQLGIDLIGSQELPRLEAQVGELRERLSQAQRGVPPRNELDNLLRSLAHQIDVRRATDHELQVRAEQHGVDYSVLPVSLKFTAPFPSVYSFLREVESMPRLIRLDRLEMTTGPEGGPVTTRIELSTFFTDSEARGR